MSQAPKTTAAHASRSSLVRPASQPTTAIITSVANSRAISMASNVPRVAGSCAGTTAPVSIAERRYTTTAASM
ncbi:MAG: hypothetical protein A2Z32_02570 [Chloroflexi bacterium RBG_16_69_14]|nr:MAG: hypothetical protein A2Z32_02570 [Chloroflexi bacterium RBG_16_69_14]